MDDTAGSRKLKTRITESQADIFSNNCRAGDTAIGYPTRHFTHLTIL